MKARCQASQPGLPDRMQTQVGSSSGTSLTADCRAPVALFIHPEQAIPPPPVALDLQICHGQDFD